MAKFVAGMALGLAIGMFGPIRADPEVSDEVLAAADEAGVDSTDLQGALNTTRMEPRSYLCAADGLLCPPAPPVSACGWPICGPLGQRLYCVEAIESRHGAAMWNSTPVWNGEHAAGFLGFLPSTARHWGAVIGSRWSEWQAAAAMIRAGAGGQFAGIAWGRC